MKVTGNADVIMATLSVGASMVDTKIASDWSGVVFLAARDGRLSMSSSRMDAQVSWSTDAVAIHADGQCAVRPADLKGALHAYGKSVVTLEVQEEKLVVGTTDATLSMSMLATAGKFPAVAEEGLQLVVDGYEVCDAFDVAQLCAHKTRGDIFNVVMLQLSTDPLNPGKQMLGVYGTNRSIAHGVKIHGYEVVQPIGDEGFSWSIPMDMVRIVANALVGEAKLELYPSRLRVRSPDGYLQASLDLQPRPILRPAKFMNGAGDAPRSFVVSRKELVEALNRADYVEAALTRTTLALDHTSGQVKVSSVGAEKSLTETIGVESVYGGSWSYLLSAAYLRDIIKTLRTPKTKITWRGMRAPLAIEDDIEREKREWQITVQMGLTG